MIVTSPTQRPLLQRRITVSGFGASAPEHEAGQASCGALDCWYYAVYGIAAGAVTGILGSLIAHLVINRKGKAT